MATYGYIYNIFYTAVTGGRRAPRRTVGKRTPRRTPQYSYSTNGHTALHLYNIYYAYAMERRGIRREREPQPQRGGREDVCINIYNIYTSELESFSTPFCQPDIFTELR
jgi:hypothetical protein